MKTMRSIVGLCLLLCAYCVFADVTMELESAEVHEGETVKLILNLDGNETSIIPDLTPLQDSFEVIGTERSMNYAFVNGKSHSVSQWVVFLQPQKTGALVIPSIKVGSKKTDEMTIHVKTEEDAESSGNASPQQATMVSASIDSKTAYVNQQLILSVKLYSHQRLVDTDYQPPKVDDALVIPLGSGHHYQTIKNGQPYEVVEQRLAIFPQKSGLMTLDPGLFHALVYSVPSPRALNKRGKPLSIQVKPAPSSFSGKQWIPAKALTLTEQYDNQSTVFEKGATLVRTLTLKTRGLPGQLLTFPDLTNNDALNTYADKPKEHTTLSQGDLLGTSTVKVTYLLNKTGAITLPGVTVTWFNIETGKEQVTTLPSRVLHVDPAHHSLQSTSVPQAPQEKTAIAQVAQSSSHSKNEVPVLEGRSSMNWGWWLSGFFACAWVLTLGGWYWQKHRLTSDKTPNEQDLWKELQRACKNNNPFDASDRLIQWATVQWPKDKILNLSHVQDNVSEHPVLHQELGELSSALYDQNHHNVWVGLPLWKALLSFKQRKGSRTQKKDVLPSMHKLS